MIFESILLGLFGIVLALVGAIVSIVAAVVLLLFRNGVQRRRSAKTEE